MISACQLIINFKLFLLAAQSCESMVVIYRYSADCSGKAGKVKINPKYL